MNQSLVDPVFFFNDLGDLHDAKIDQITWSVAARTITLDVDDLNANFDGLPEYGGKKKASITFCEVENILLNCDARKDDTQRIYALEMLKKGDSGKYELMMRISPSGRLSFDCYSVKIADTGDTLSTFSGQQR